MTLQRVNDLDAGIMELLNIPDHIRFEDDHFVIDYGGYEYDIERSRIKTHAQLVEWVLHLSEKRWMDPPRLRYFASLVAKHNNLPFDGSQSL